MFTNLLYVGDVPVEASYHGSALLHRLLSGHPHEKLTVIETATQSEPKRRLPNVNYISHPIGKQRWLNTRFHPYAVAWFSHAGTRVGPKIAQSLNGFRVEGVLTVAHGFGWLAAARIAEERRVPLHLMIHDDWPRAAVIAPAFRNWLDARFGDVYRQAQSRLCVSPAMSKFYHERYGKPAHVIYPSRAADCPQFDEPPELLSRNDKPFTIAFAGTINSNGYIRALIKLQEALKPVGGRLLIFGPLTSGAARQAGFDDQHTEVCGLLGWSDLMARLRDEADALFVPMSFDACDRANMEMAFPSKLADCTATGLPLLIYGPSYCSAVVWARENEGVAEIVEAEAQLDEAIERLANDPAHRVSLGRHALDVGREYFTHDRVQEIFSAALCETSASSALKTTINTETAEKSFLDRTALALFKKVPTRAAHHLLFLAQSRPELSDRWGYHIRPIHYYEPLPDFRAITVEQINRKRAFPAIDFRLDAQRTLLNELSTYRDEFRKLDFDFDNDYFSGLDAAVYYSLVRHLQPRRIIEIGGGYSTRIAAKALTTNQKGTLTCIEPYPEERLSRANLNVELITKRVEEIDPDFFSCLEANDILFIDSSHTVKFGSDVCYEFLEIMPRLARGVWVHIHDIFFPQDYPAEWLMNRRMALNEQYLLEAFLAFSTTFSVQLANYWLCLEHMDEAARLWSNASTSRASSFWMKRVE